MGRYKPLGSLNSYTSQLSEVNPVSLFTLLLASFPSSSAITLRGGSVCRIAVLGVFIPIWRPEITDGGDISCLLIWKEVFSFHRRFSYA